VVTGKPVVVMSWPAVPVEIVRATGCRPAYARGSARPTPAADVHLEAGIFPSRLHHLVDDALTGRLADAACIVLPRTSDADYKCFLYLREFVRRGIAPHLPPIVLFDLLQSSGALVREYDIARTRALCNTLASVSGRTPSADELLVEITRANGARAAARRLLALRGVSPRVTGSDVFPLLAAWWDLDAADYAVMADDAAHDIAARRPLAGPRVLLAGVPLDTDALHRIIESHGAIVTAEIGPWGSGVAGDDVGVDADPVAALADRYRAEPTGPRTAAALWRWTEPHLDDIDLVVVSLPPEDAVFGWDYPKLRERLHARGIPHVCVFGDPHQPLSAADDARLAAAVASAPGLQEARRG
jgi:benzoyl-CoA reductase/2-hydroxyglutaryl-CoA dehydratase subunit BcrC/BadD/HgdB